MTFLYLSPLISSPHSPPMRMAPLDITPDVSTADVIPCPYLARANRSPEKTTSGSPLWVLVRRSLVVCVFVARLFAVWDGSELYLNWMGRKWSGLKWSGVEWVGLTG